MPKANFHKLGVDSLGIEIDKYWAPDIRPGYPSGGDIIGPLWARTWFLLNHPTTKGQALTVGQIQNALQYPVRRTVQSLLRQATQVGLLESVTETKPGEHAFTKRYRLAGTGDDRG